MLKLVFIDFLETTMADTPDRAEYWRRHVEAWRSSGLSQRDYCTQHALKPHRLSYWVRRLAKAPRTLTFVPMPVKTETAALTLQARQWHLEFAVLPPVDWLAPLLARLP